MAPDGQLDQGEFLLEKPGKLRFEYNPPNPTLIVATGGKFYVKNGRLNTVDSYDISDTPLGLLLSDNVDLKTNSAVTGIDIRPDALVVHARTFNNRQQQGIITMVFSNPQIELRQWTVKDNQGGTTMVALAQSRSHGAARWTRRCSTCRTRIRPAKRHRADAAAGGHRLRSGNPTRTAAIPTAPATNMFAPCAMARAPLPLLIPASDPPLDAALLERLDGLLFTGAPSNVAAWRYGGAVLAPGTATG